MAVGLATKFNILQQSPHDFAPPTVDDGPEVVPETAEWIPSRYNVRATTEDGRLVLWNSFRGSLSVFPAEQREKILPLIRKSGFSGAAEGVVEYLVERGFLIRRGTDERRRLQLSFGRKHYQTDMLELILLSSEDCNFRCQYCYEEFARGTMEPWVRTAIKKALEKRLAGLRALRISWFGGEPLYGWPAIEDLAPFFDQKAKERDLFFGSHMTTNGYLLTPDVQERLLKWRVASYQITVDGSPEDHDCNRPTRDGQGTFHTIFDNLKALHRRSEEFRVNLRVNFDKNNYPRMDSFLDMVQAELGNDPRFRLQFQPVGRWGGPKDADLEVCGHQESRDIQRELKKTANERGMYLGSTLKDVKVGSQVCYAARPYSYLIGATGKIMKCTVALDMKDYNIVGQITPEGEFDLDDDKYALWTEPAFENDGQCQKCVIVPTCQGMFCPMIRIENDRSPCPPSRLHLKDEMLQAVDLLDSRPRKVKAALRAV